MPLLFDAMQICHDRTASAGDHTGSFGVGTVVT
jgi:hypothetical protein